MKKPVVNHQVFYMDLKATAQTVGRKDIGAETSEVSVSVAKLGDSAENIHGSLPFSRSNADKHLLIRDLPEQTQTFQRSYFSNRRCWKKQLLSAKNMFQIIRILDDSLHHKQKKKNVGIRSL